MPAATETAAYVYGVTWAGRVRGGGEGVRGGAVTTVEHGELAALVSDAGSEPLRAKRRDLLRHSDVLQDAFASAPVLPFRFGTVLVSQESVVDELLAPRYEELVALLQRFDGLSELRLHARFVEDAVLGEIVRDEPRVAALREATRTAPPNDPRRFELGETVARALAARRTAAADALVATLVSVALEVHGDEERDNLEVLRASFLVDAKGARKLEQRAEAFAAEQRGRIELELLGPMPPHTFVSLHAGGR